MPGGIRNKKRLDLEEWFPYEAIFYDTRHGESVQQVKPMFNWWKLTRSLKDKQIVEYISDVRY